MNTVVTQIMFLLLQVDAPTTVSIHSAWVSRSDCNAERIVVQRITPNTEFYCSKSTIILHEVKQPKGARANA